MMVMDFLLCYHASRKYPLGNGAHDRRTHIISAIGVGGIQVDSKLVLIAALSSVPMGILSMQVDSMKHI